MRAWFWFAALLCMLGAAFSAGAEVLAQSELRQLQQEANQYFREANAAAQAEPERARDLYAKALLRFDRILNEGGVKNGMLYYNIGNVYFYLGDLGRAILNYRRAGRFTPGDANLLQNLSFARSRRTDKIDERTEQRVLKTLLFWHYDLSLPVRFYASAVFFLAFWAAAAVRLVRPEAVPGWTLAAAGALALVLGASAAWQQAADAASREGVIVASEIVARKGDGESYQPSFKDPLHAGTEFKVLEERPGWYQIELGDGRSTWVPGTAVEII